MSYSPIAFTAPNYRDYKNYWLKAYEPGTTTPKTMSNDAEGTTLSSKYEVNNDGFFVSSGGTLVIPHINGNYDLWLFPTESEADANDTTDAERLADDISASSQSFAANSTLQFDTVADAVASEDLKLGYMVFTHEYSTGNGGGAQYTVVAGGSGSEDFGLYHNTDNGLQLKLSHDGWVDVEEFGAKGDGINDDTSNIDNAINSGLNLVFKGNGVYLVSSLLNFNSSNATYKGNGAVIKLQGGSNSTMFYLVGGSPSEPRENVTFERLVFDGNGSNQNTTSVESNNNGIEFSGSNFNNINFINCEFRNMGAQTYQPPNVNVSPTYGHGDGLVQKSSSATGMNNITVNGCHFENLWAGVAIRGTGEGFKFLNNTFNHCGDNSMKTRTTATNVDARGNFDSDTRGAEIWGTYINYSSNHCVNSHRHGVSGGMKYATVSGNKFVHTVSGLGSAYAIEIGVSEQCRVANNFIQDWDGNAAIRMTDTAQGSKGTIVTGNTVQGGVFSDGGIGSSNSQDDCIYDANIVVNATGVAMDPRGSNLVITNNTVIDTSTNDLATSNTTGCLVISTGSGHVISNNSFSLAARWVAGTYKTVITGTFDSSIITNNRFYGGRNTISGGLASAIVKNNLFSSVEKIINTDTGSQGSIVTSNILDNIGSGFDTSDLDGMAYDFKRESAFSAAPTTGTWSKGDRVWNGEPSTGAVVGWLCVSAGTPGTWKSFGTVS